MEISSAAGLRSATHAPSGPEARAGSTQAVSSLQLLSLRAPGASCRFLPGGAGGGTRAAGRRRGPFIHPGTGASYR
jgi:hypothetical protein